MNGNEILYFEWDGEDQPETYWDSTAGWWIQTAPVEDQIFVNDSSYRRFILGKIFKNQVTGGTVPEVIVFIKIVFDIDASLYPVAGEPMAYDLYVPFDTADTTVAILESKRSDSTVTNDYFIPLPVGVRLNSVIKLDAPFFAFDATAYPLAGWDEGAWEI